MSTKPSLTVKAPVVPVLNDRSGFYGKDMTNVTIDSNRRGTTAEFAEWVTGFAEVKRGLLPNVADALSWVGISGVASGLLKLLLISPLYVAGWLLILVTLTLTAYGLMLLRHMLPDYWVLFAYRLLLIGFGLVVVMGVI
jgi:hypothetical protein